MKRYVYALEGALVLGIVAVLAFGGGAPGYTSFAFNSMTRLRTTADATNATTTLSSMTDVTLNVSAGKKYTGKLIVKCINSTATEGIKLDFNGGTATMTSFWASASETAGGTTVLGTAISTSLAGVINYTTITGETVLEINVSFVVNGAGTVIPRFAENSTAIGTATVRLGSFSWIQDSP